MQSPKRLEKLAKLNPDNQNYIQNRWQKYKKKGWLAIPAFLILVPKGGLLWAGLIGAGTFFSNKINEYASNHPYQIEGKVIEMSINENYHGKVKVGVVDDGKKNLHLIVQNSDKEKQAYKSLENKIIHTFEHIKPGDSVLINAYDGVFRDYATNIEKK